MTEYKKPFSHALKNIAYKIPPSNNKSVFKRFDIRTVLFLITEMDERNGAWVGGGGRVAGGDWVSRKNNNRM